MAQKVCILYGINEGPAMAKGLMASLRKAGFQITSDVQVADVILAHSGGCFLIPAKHPAKTVVLIGLPFWPGRPWIFAVVKKVWREGRTHYHEHKLRRWCVKWLHHLRYSLNWKHALDMGFNRDLNKAWNSPSLQYVVRNRYDEFCTPDIATLAYKGPRKFISMPDEHDDCWEHPERYVDLLQSL